ncbi:MAG TPA: hypothetical protein VFS92_05850, partial [Planctomycetota bacterium]|nr:hypothetical protein [Planctomycetota bacterium]
MRSLLGAPLVFAAALLSAAPPALARYSPIPLGERTLEAQVIAVGRIEALEERYYRFAVERWLHGEPRQATLRVRRFEDWTCASRPVPYAVGQRMVVFLKEFENEWLVMGAGCEGEALLADGKARVIHSPMGAEGDLWPEEEFVMAVATYRVRYVKPGEDG